MAPNCRMVDPFLQSSLKMWYALRATPEPHPLAEVVPPFAADATLATWYSYLERHSVTNTETVDPGPDCDHHAR
jgi:hypothetical protein